MKIGVLDFWFGRTHRRINVCYAELLSRDSKVEVVAIDFCNYYKELEQVENITFPKAIINNKETNSIQNRIRYIFNIYQNKKALKSELDSIDFFIVTEYELISFSVYQFIFSFKKPVYLFHHQHLDRLSNKLNMFFFKTYMKKVKHIVLEDIFKEHLIKISNLNARDIYVVPHPLIAESKLGVEKKNTFKYFFLGISSNNDENLVEKIMIKERELGLFKKNNIRVLLRSQNVQFDNGFLTISNKYLSDDEFDDLYNEADVILTLVTKEFVNRVSGSVMDAIAKGKSLIGVDIPIIKMYESLCPSIIKSFSTVNDMMELMLKSKFEINQNELEILRERHSNRAVVNALKQLYEK